jgi:hypothetical protein
VAQYADVERESLAFLDEAAPGYGLLAGWWEPPYSPKYTKATALSKLGLSDFRLRLLQGRLNDRMRSAFPADWWPLGYFGMDGVVNIGDFIVRMCSHSNTVPQS